MGLDEVPPGTNDVSLSDFRDTIYDHYRRHGRPMPWRETRDPYAILVSEIMLQQTQSERVLPKYRDFLARFPDVTALARASLQDVLMLWQGLGYNRRARMLHEAARSIVTERGGEFPRTPGELRMLPGVGPYTAGAVAAFAFGEPAVFVETNIRRVFLQVFFPGREQVPDRELFPLVAATLDYTDPRSWYYALMDYGAYLSQAYGNANRRSAHYTRQSPFAGSVRQVRGAIVRLLAEVGEIETAELERRVAPGDDRYGSALVSLERDGMIVREGSQVRLP
jgi:A/G-specific adenine glycosylase